MYYDIPRNESLRDNINAAKTLVIILIIFFVCWFPFFLTYILSFVGKVRIQFYSCQAPAQLSIGLALFSI